ncbi:MAG: type IX secretion system PorP/SprF family membrane protein [Bacteroidia bacterium]|jgi:type IX secretion system PorP/SprF family membrane protein
MYHITLLFTIFLSASTLIFAQQDPYFAHFMFNKQAYNPAAVGSTNDFMCFSAVAHNQWVGYNDNTWVNRNTGGLDGISDLPLNVAPKTYNFNIGGQIVNRLNRIGGIGISLSDDRLGAMKTSSFKTQLAYFLSDKNGNRLAIGGEIGIVNFGFVNPKFRARQLNDPHVPKSSVTRTKPDFSAGLYYTQKRLLRYGKMFYAGLSIQHLNEVSFRLIAPSTNVNYTFAKHYYFLTGFTVQSASGMVDWKPSILIKYNSEPQVNVNLIAERLDKFRFGIGYRQGGNADALIGYLGFIEKQMILGYSYDITMSKIRQVSGGTHEIAVKWCFQKKKLFYHKTTREM